MINSASNVAWALCTEGKKAGLCYTVPECNSVGLGLMGGGNLGDCFEKVLAGAADTSIILENDLYLRAESQTIEAVIQKCKNLIIIDHIWSRTAREANVGRPPEHLQTLPVPS